MAAEINLMESPAFAQDTAVFKSFDNEFLFKEKPVYDFFKRLFDIIFSFLALAVLALPLLVVMFIIWLIDKGNPIFVQERIGKNGKPFMIYKLRTMIVGAEDRLQEVIDIGDKDNPILFKPQEDPRITKVGRILRKLSIDEFPQFINVLKGEMSLIGPRPLMTVEHNDLSKYMKGRDSVKPGLSCYSVVDAHLFRKGIYENRISADMRYINKRSLLVDLHIVIMTAWCVIIHRNF